MSQNHESIDINIQLITASILKRLKLITVITVSLGIISFVLSMQIPNIYKSHALISIKSNDESNSMSSLMSQYGGLASMAGINIPSGSKDKLYKAIAVLNSKSFFNQINKKHSIDIDLYAMRSFDILKNQPEYKKNIYDINSKKWIRKVKPPMEPKPSDLELHKHFLKKIFSLSKDPETDFLSISIRHPSPEFAQALLNIVLNELNQVIKNKDLAESDLALEYLNKELTKTNISEVRKSINQLIEVQLKTNMMASIQEDYVFEVIDPPFKPEIKSSPNRILLTFLGMFIGLFSSVLFVLFGDILRQRR